MTNGERNLKPEYRKVLSCAIAGFVIRISSFEPRHYPTLPRGRWRPCQATASSRFTKLIPKTDPQRPARLHNVPVQRHGAPTADRLGDPDSHGVRRLQRDHVTVPLVGDELHRAGAESRAQQTVERRRPAAALQMAEHTNARFF